MYQNISGTLTLRQIFIQNGCAFFSLEAIILVNVNVFDKIHNTEAATQRKSCSENMQQI